MRETHADTLTPVCAWNAAACSVAERTPNQEALSLHRCTKQVGRGARRLSQQQRWRSPGGLPPQQPGAAAAAAAARRRQCRRAGRVLQPGRRGGRHSGGCLPPGRTAAALGALRRPMRPGRCGLPRCTHTAGVGAESAIQVVCREMGLQKSERAQTNAAEEPLRWRAVRRC